MEDYPIMTEEEFATYKKEAEEKERQEREKYQNKVHFEPLDTPIQVNDAVISTGMPGDMNEDYPIMTEEKLATYQKEPEEKAWQELEEYQNQVHFESLDTPITVREGMIFTEGINAVSNSEEYIDYNKPAEEFTIEEWKDIIRGLDSLNRDLDGLEKQTYNMATYMLQEKMKEANLEAEETQVRHR